MLTRCLALILIASLFTGAGGHLALIQSIAWTIAWIYMIQERWSGYESLSVLIQSVFFGKNLAPYAIKCNA